MVKKISLKNFQSHEDTEVVLHPGVNTFIGTSNHGKSAIIRAIGLVRENKPDGTQFVSHWLWDKNRKAKGDTEVEIEFDNGTVKRVKGKNNYYYVNDAELSAFGRGGVPEEVSTIMNMSDINVHKQEESFFLLNMGSSEIMRRMNSYVNLELIDKTLSNAEADSRRNAGERRSSQSKIDDFESKLLKFKDLEERETKFREIVGMWNQIKVLKKRIQDSRNLLNSFERISLELANIGPIDQILTKIKQAFDLFALHDQYTQSLHHWSGVIDRYNNARQEFVALPARKIEEGVTKVSSVFHQADDVANRISKARDFIERIPQLQIEVRKLQVPDLTVVAAVFDEAVVLEKLIEDSKKYLVIESMMEEYVRLMDEYRRLEEEYHKGLKGACPFCGRKS